jgi:hypothetical protein
LMRQPLFMWRTLQDIKSPASISVEHERGG